MRTTREEQIASAAKKCRHFNGVQNKACDAGVTYDSLPREIFGAGKFVCFGESSGCPKFEAEGMEAARKRWEEHDRHTANYIKARKAISDKVKGQVGIQGVIGCPVCNTGQLHYSISSYNGHCHGRCTTQGCVAWME